jgi:glycosyltransferase involved in cell wall biosynthesis
MKRTGQQSSVLNVDPRAPQSNEYIKVSGAPGLLLQLLRHASDEWLLSVHTNGHNPKSWGIAFACGLAAQVGAGATLTLHSGLVPAYLREDRSWKRLVARMTCLLYDRIVCVNEEIAAAIAELGIARDNMQITPAFLPIEIPDVTLPEPIEHWMQGHAPFMTATMFFRPEYGFDVLIEAVARLRERFPHIGCLVMGTGEDRSEAEALVGRSGLSDSMYLAGDLDHEWCLAVMARSAVFVRPTFRDGDSISVREALALAVPVVASNVGTRPEGTILFEPGNVDACVEAVAKVFQTAAERRKILSPLRG